MNEDVARRVEELLASGHEPGAELYGIELWWRDHQEWLAERGYTLRPRYRPGWKASWVGRLKKYQYAEDFEDAHMPTVRCPTCPAIDHRAYYILKYSAHRRLGRYP